MKQALNKPLGSDSQYVVSIINAIQIQVANFIYTWVANALTAEENHRTMTG